MIISPIDIVAKHENRCISTATEWISLSLLSNGLVYDHSHNFNPGPNYHYSERIRALSDDSDFFIHESGEFVLCNDRIFCNSAIDFLELEKSFEMMSLDSIPVWG